jgi:hypothetical protein
MVAAGKGSTSALEVATQCCNNDDRWIALKGINDYTFEVERRKIEAG